MKLRDDDLKRIYQASRREPPLKEAACPSEEQIMKSFSGEMSEEDKSKITDHVTGCRSCHWKFEAIRQILSGVGEMAKELEGVSLSEQDVRRLRKVAKDRIHELERERRESKSRGSRKKFQSLFASGVLRYVPAAAGLLMIVLAAFLIFKTPPGPERDIARGPADQVVELIEPKGEVKDYPLVFRWRPYPKAEDYEVKLLDEELTDLWKSERIRTNEVALPQSQLQRMEKERTYYWKVIVRLKAGTLKESAPQEFKLR